MGMRTLAPLSVCVVAELTEFLPVALERCALPSFDLGAGETLDTLHSVDLSQDWDAAIHQLVRAMTRDEARPAA